MFSFQWTGNNEKVRKLEDLIDSLGCGLFLKTVKKFNLLEQNIFVSTINGKQKTVIFCPTNKNMREFLKRHRDDSAKILSMAKLHIAHQVHGLTYQSLFNQQKLKIHQKTSGKTGQLVRYYWKIYSLIKSYLCYRFNTLAVKTNSKNRSMVVFVSKRV